MLEELTPMPTGLRVARHCGRHAPRRRRRRRHRRVEPWPSTGRSRSLVYQAWALNMLGGGGRYDRDDRHLPLVFGRGAHVADQYFEDRGQRPARRGHEPAAAGRLHLHAGHAGVRALLLRGENTLPDGTKQIVLATNRPTLVRRRDRPGSPAEVRPRHRRDAFPEEGGEGEGKIIVQGMASIDDKTGKIEVNNYSGQPTRLMQIKEIKP